MPIAPTCVWEDSQGVGCLLAAVLGLQGEPAEVRGDRLTPP